MATIRKATLADRDQTLELLKQFPPDPEISHGARLDFTLAAYNAGPARVASLRREAATKGYDPNLWFGNVETIAAVRIGRETVTYVSNINKYYMAYSDFYRGNLQRELQIQSLANAPRN